MDADSFIASAVQAGDAADSTKKRERSPQAESNGAAKKVRIDAPISISATENQQAGSSEPKR